MTTNTDTHVLWGGDFENPEGSLMTEKKVYCFIKYNSICASGLNSGTLGHTSINSPSGIQLITLTSQSVRAPCQEAERSWQALPLTLPMVGLANHERPITAVFTL